MVRSSVFRNRHAPEKPGIPLSSRGRVRVGVSPSRISQRNRMDKEQVVSLSLNEITDDRWDDPKGGG
jgi:hypothetical protein